MIKTKISDKEYLIPSSWNDITFLKYCDVVSVHEKSWNERLSCYTGIEMPILEKLSMQGLITLCETTSFLDSPDDVMSFALPFESDLKIGHESYEKLEASKQAIQLNHELPLKAAVAVIKFYTEEDISDKPITQTIGQAVFFLTLLESLWRGIKDFPNTNLTQTKWKLVSKSLQDLAHGEQPLPTPVGQT